MIDQVTNTISYVGGHATAVSPRSYAIPFRFDEASWIHCTVDPPLPSGETLLHTFSEPRSAWQTKDGSVSVKTDLTGRRLTITRKAPAVQMLDLIPNAPLPAEDLERTLDHLVMALIDRDVTHGAVDGGGIPASDGALRALMFPGSEPQDYPTHLPSAMERKGKFIGFNGTTGKMEVRELSAKIEDITAEILAIAAELQLYFLRQANGGIKVADLGGNAGGEDSITLQTRRSQPVNVASGPMAIAIGDSLAEGEHAVAVGDHNAVSAHYSTALGYMNIANGYYYTTAVGSCNSAYGEWSSAFGYGNYSSGLGAFAAGTSVKAQGFGTAAFGYGTIASGNNVSEMANAGYDNIPSSRVRADGHSGIVSLSYGSQSAPLAAATTPTGHEPSGYLPQRMLGFRVTDSTLRIDINVSGTVRTISLPIP